MDLGEKMTELENRIYNEVVATLQKEDIPSTVGRVIMDAVYRRFVESAYYVTLLRAERLERELLPLREKAEQPGEAEV